MRRPERAGGRRRARAAVGPIRRNAVARCDGWSEHERRRPEPAQGRPCGHRAGSANGAGHGRRRLGLHPFRTCALPGLDLTQIDLRASLLGKTMRAPLLISSMTGGMPRVEAINRHLSETAQALGIAMCVGSQRVSLQSRNSQGLTRALRRLAPDVPLAGQYRRRATARGRQPGPRAPGGGCRWTHRPSQSAAGSRTAGGRPRQARRPGADRSRRAQRGRADRGQGSGVGPLRLGGLCARRGGR